MSSLRSLQACLTKVVLSALASALLFSGCTGGGTTSKEEMKQLKERISALEKENNLLRAQVENLKNRPNNVELPADRPKKDELPIPREQSNESALKQVETKHPQFQDLTDVPTQEMIEDLEKLGVFDGMSNHFKPYQPITRGEYVTWLFEAYNALEPEAKQLRFAPQLAQQFKDTPPTHSAYKYVQSLANAGYSIGYKDGTFKPDKPLTREEMIGIKVGVDVGKTLDPWRSQMETVWKFSDAKEVDERFTGYIHQDYYVSGPHGSNIQRAFGKIGTFKPKTAVLRSEAAATLWQMGQFGDTQPTNAKAILLKEQSQP